MTEKIPTIHRDKSFEFKGRQYRVRQGSDQHTVEWDGYSIVAVLSDRPGDEADIEDGFYRLADVRDYLRRATDEGWAYLSNTDGDDPHERTSS